MIMFPNVSLMRHLQCDREQSETVRTHKGTGARGGRGVVSGQRDPLCQLFSDSPQAVLHEPVVWAGLPQRMGGAGQSHSGHLRGADGSVLCCSGSRPFEGAVSREHPCLVPRLFLPALKAAVTGSPPRVHPPTQHSDFQNELGPHTSAAAGAGPRSRGQSEGLGKDTAQAVQGPAHLCPHLTSKPWPAASPS